jgi:hypothetical protein
MAFDTLLDKTQLENAMVATAESIRDKSGETAAISWDANTGFASAIAAISTGGGGDIHTVTTDCGNASVVVEYFRKLRPSGCNDMIVALKPPSDVTALSKFENGQMLVLVLNGTKAGYARWYSNAVNVQTTFTTSYTCKCWAGDEYFLLPLV